MWEGKETTVSRERGPDIVALFKKVLEVGVETRSKHLKDKKTMQTVLGKRGGGKQMFENF